jgi:hypothetical protein
MERETAKEAGKGEGEKKKREERERENLGNSFCIRRRGADLHLLLLLLVSLLLLLPSCRLGERGDRRLREGHGRAAAWVRRMRRGQRRRGLPRLEPLRPRRRCGPSAGLPSSPRVPRLLRQRRRAAQGQCVAGAVTRGGGAGLQRGQSRGQRAARRRHRGGGKGRDDGLPLPSLLRPLLRLLLRRRGRQGPGSQRPGRDRRGQPGVLQRARGAQPRRGVDDEQRGYQVLRLGADRGPDLVLEVVVLSAADEAEELGLALGPEGLVAGRRPGFWFRVGGLERFLEGGRRERRREKREAEREERLSLSASKSKSKA